MGDFNEGPQDGVQHKILQQFPQLLDPWKSLNKKETGTYHKFDGNYHDKKRIDWILTSQNLTPIDINFEPNPKKGIYPSDHFPVRLSLKF
jgi:endonuclease/exonuclease/phosphatase family metal-dependent hydrolase